MFLIILALVVQSCSIKFVSSSKRLPKNQVLTINSNIQLSLTGAVYMNFFGLMKADFIPASTQIIIKKKVVYIDPLNVADTLKADYIFITHAHADHFWPTDIENLSKPTTILVAPRSVLKKIKTVNCVESHLTEKYFFDEFICEVVPAYNLKHKKTNLTIHKHSNEFNGYVLTIDSIRIYHAGDTDFIPEMNKLHQLDIALLPIGTGKTAMTPSTAAAAANQIKPDIVVPIHYEPGKGHEIEFSKWVDKQIKVELLNQSK